MLLQLAVAHCDFNEEDYFEQNPDVKDAVKLGRVENGFIHYIGFGYFEGRRGGIPAVDESWYLNKYPDVAAGVRAGAINGAKDHFYNIGAAEGRSPNSDNESEALRWKQAIKP
ncbi:MAG: hypothetical protein P4L81_02875 [Candidatus Pacebacteria bacterium]|nr:hypothetical protein [Candidatus Paceibacterota bacterium]